ncbi:MAG TPA: hypothetical protein PLI09_12485 [Candidatus Hydrogenedentes bacterium]|nr:hypothetical protein [Candidatus Hydrogenedentota bacterium]
MKSNPNERLYFVSIHYALKEPRDWQWINRHLVVKCTNVVPRLARDLGYLRRVLRARRDKDGQLWKGFAFIFLDPGWTNLLGGLSPLRTATLEADLIAAQTEIEKSLEQEIKLHNSTDSKSERIVTAGNLLYLLDLLDTAARGRGDSFYRLFVGGAQTLKYDAPKVVEAAIRIANIGRGIPLFRFDDDVIFFGQRLPDRQETEQNATAETTAGNILKLCERYQNTLEHPLIRYFVYSGGYEAPRELNMCNDNDPRLLNGFATRVLQLTQLPKQRNPQTEETTEGVIKASVAKAFLEEIVKLGANPFRQVVSGAGLCLSDGAILDLPPYSNMHLNVMWIDDHLKYALHDELGHFGRWTRTHHHYVARVEEARFSQLRHVCKEGSPFFTYKDVKWHLQTYMLRLLLGCVADSWLRGKEQTKERTSGLKDIAYNALVLSVPHIYGDKFMEIIPGGWETYLDDKDKKMDEFKQRLWQKGCERLKRAVELWSDSIYENTFLGLYVHGLRHARYKEFKDFFPAGMPNGLANAVHGLPEDIKIVQRPSPNALPDDPNLEQALITLVDDFVDYLSLVQFWPFFIQSVRCFQNQHTQYRLQYLEWMFPIPEDPV